MISRFDHVHDVCTVTEAAYVAHRDRKTIEARCESGALTARRAGRGKRRTWLICLKSLAELYNLDLDRLEEMHNEAK